MHRKAIPDKVTGDWQRVRHRVPHQLAQCVYQLRLGVFEPFVVQSVTDCG
jgi:hypothetical protein